MEKLIRVRAMKRLYYEPENRTDQGKLYMEGQEFDVEPSRFSDYDKPITGIKGHVVRGSMRRVTPSNEPLVVADTDKPAKGKKG